jgi:hypothetical protein
VRALRGEQEQAAVQLWDGDTLVEHREPIVRVHVQFGQGASRDAEDVTVVGTAKERLAVGHVVGTALEGPGQLVATWLGGRGVGAARVGPER